MDAFGPANPLHAQQRPYAMPLSLGRHEGHHHLIHEIEQNATASLSSTSISTFNTTVNDTQHGNSTTGGHGDHPPRPRSMIWYFSRIINILIILVILLITINRLIAIIRHKHTIRKISRRDRTKKGHAPIPTEDPDTPMDEGGHGGGEGVREQLVEGKRKGKFRLRALSAVQRNWCYLRTVPRWLYGPETMLDAFWTVLYCAVLITFGCWEISWERKLYVANQMGIMAYCQVPVIIILIQKNNPISFLTGITYQKLNYLHRASSRACLLFSWIHVAIWFLPVWNAGHFRRGYIWWGLGAIFGYTMLWITSFRIVRRLFFEFFLISHIIFTLFFIVGGIFHWTRLNYWLWPTLVIWGFDRLLRTFWLVWINPPTYLRWFKLRKSAAQAGECTTRLMDHDVMMLTCKRPGLKWTAGQHFFISSPGVSTMAHETHPFSIANMPNDRDEVVFLVRVHSGFTRRLRDKLSGDTTTDIPIYLDGPYGSSHSLASYSTVVLVAGGTGITFLSSNLLGLLHPTAPQIPRHIHLVWHIRHSEDVSWLAPLLNEMASLLPRYPQTRLTLDVHVTKSHRSDEPAPQGSLTERLIEDYAPADFARRFSRNVPKPEIQSGMPSAADSDDGVIEDDEDDDAEEALLPKPIVVRPNGLTVEAASMLFWKKGRADLRAVLEEDVEASEGDVIVTVCGPIQLMHAARKAVMDVATPKRAMEGQVKVDFYEETLGS